MKNKPQISDSDGFTIIELLFATAIFSLVMTVILFATFQIGRTYFKGVSISNTNESARAIIDDITNDVRFAQGATKVDPSPWAGAPPRAHFFCVGEHRYTYVLYDQVTNEKITKNQLTGVREEYVGTACPSPDKALPGINTQPKQLLGPDMQLNDLVFDCSNGACTVGVHIIFYGADNTVFNSSAHPADTDADHAAALTDPDSFCSGNSLSTQFCATADLQTKVLQRG